jgi:asparagine synthetase B (glutamine-hydrolysing)
VLQEPLVFFFTGCVMNVFFGIASKNNNNDFSLMREKIGLMYNLQTQQLSDLSGLSNCGFICDNGAILGKANGNGYFLVFLGILQEPLPAWEYGSPLDHPDFTADYLLTRYKAWGTHFLDGINGQFAISLYDEDKKSLFLASDPTGYRKLFYYHNNNQFVYGTSLAALAQGSRSGLKVDRSMEDFLLGYEFLPWDRTLFEGVMSLPKGTLLEFNHGIVKQTNIFTPLQSQTAEHLTNEPDVINYLYDQFMHSLSDLSPTDNNIAVLLGGFDSALVASALTRLGKKVRTFTFRFPDARFNQPKIKRLSDYLGHEHTWIDITPDVIREGLKIYPLCFNQPASQMHYLILTAYSCSVIRRQGYKHCMTGDGCDEIFLGYPTVYTKARLFSHFGVLPAPIVKAMLFLLSPRLLEKHFGHVARMARNTARVLGYDYPLRGHITHRVFDEVSLSYLRGDAPPPQQMDIEAILRQLALGLENMSILKLAYHGKSAVGLNKNKVEGCSAFTGLTIQSPFQSPRLSLLAGSLPEELLRPKNTPKAESNGKYILMRMAAEKKLLPNDIIYQQKQSPVKSPVDYWYMTSLKNTMIAAVNDLVFDYDSHYVEDLCKHKLPESLFRKHVGISHYTMNAISLLVTYASYMRYTNSVTMS